MASDQGQTSPGVKTGDNTTPQSTTSQKYVCADCGKSYRAKETLNRHRKNHSRQAEHVCEVCSVGFRRKDLLLRHSKIHQGDDSTSGHPRDRQRIRQACDRCSRLKVKCNAEVPCSVCVRGDHRCTYTGRNSTRSRRQSVEM